MWINGKLISFKNHTDGKRSTYQWSTNNMSKYLDKDNTIKNKIPIANEKVLCDDRITYKLNMKYGILWCR